MFLVRSQLRDRLCTNVVHVRNTNLESKKKTLPPPHLNCPSDMFSPWRVLTLLLITSISVKGITVTGPMTAPASAPLLSRSLVSFSIEQDRWGDWVGQGAGNPFFFNTLDNLKQLTGEPARIRIGADSEDRTNFNPSVQVWLYFSSGNKR